MASIKQIRLEEKAALRQQQLVHELDALVKSIERCEKTIVDLKLELEEVNRKHQGRRTTEDDIAYLTDLLKCAHKKLSWEKQLMSLHKRTPATLQKMSALVNDPAHPVGDQMQASLLAALQGVQAAMARLEQVKVD